MTGGNPKTTGVYYDVEYSHTVDEAGAACTPGQPATGGDVIYDSPDDALAAVPDFIDPTSGTFPSFDANGSIYANGADTDPAAIMNLKFDPTTSLNSATFPGSVADLGGHGRGELLRRRGGQRTLPGCLRRGAGGHRVLRTHQARRARRHEPR